MVLLEPPGYAHTGIVTEAAETIHHGILGLGLESTLQTNTLYSDRVNIVFGGHLLPAMAGWDAQGTERLVIFNLEPVRPELVADLPGYVDLLRSCRVWDYDAGNVDRLRAVGVESAAHVPLGYAAPMTRIESVPVQPIDVLFYGTLNKRRLRLRDRLAAMGLETRFVFGVYGRERDALIAQSKVVVAPSRFDAGGVFDIVRLSYLLSNRKAIVMESGVDAAQEAEFADAVAFASYDDLPGECAYLCEVAAERAALEQRGFAHFSGRLQSQLLQAPVQAVFRDVAAKS